ncbi:MAG: PDZ domain-containing protein [Candidatus Aminicenantes bacterium]|nr:PDZ domain-containing protein [Candidatus Aminicenantes bacterium]
MKKYFTILLSIAVVIGWMGSAGLAADTTMTFTVSMPHPETHIFHVIFRTDGLQGEMQDFKMPAWMPGFYRIMDYHKNVSNFHAEDAAGKTLPWEKATKNTWRVVSGNAPTIVVSYDVFGNTAFAANNFLGEQRAFIAPPGLFMFVAGQIRHPVTVTFEIPPNWTRIATGLDPVPGRPNTFSAPDFDVFYDCPVLLGNQELEKFEVKGIPHRMAIENVPEGVDRRRMSADLKRMVEAATDLMGDIPYKHYTFLLIGMGNGGIEHANSAACAFNGKSLTDEKGYQGWLSYISHEYFHHFNVKRIRPLALGPFDYDEENLTDMLWVSEGLTVYYEDIVLVRAGLMTPDQFLERMKNAMTRFENASGHHYQSTTESSLYTWGTSGVGGDRNTTISYYDNGGMLGAMLDLAIRNQSANRKSLDDVMRALYRTYDLGKKRGFTDAEFRAECERAAGGSLAEVFDYAATTKDVNYAKYFAYAGLKVEATAQDAPGAALGFNTQTVDGKLTIVEVGAGSSARGAGLSAQDQILELDGTKATPKVLNDILAAKKPGDTVKVRYSREGAAQEIEIALGKNFKNSYTITPIADPAPLQAAIFKDWLRKAL